MPNQNQVKHVPAGTGPMYWGPGDRVPSATCSRDGQAINLGWRVVAADVVGAWQQVPNGPVVYCALSHKTQLLHCDMKTAHSKTSKASSHSRLRSSAGAS